MEIDISFFNNETQKILIDLEKTQHEFWNIDRFSANFLYNEIIKNSSINVLEIGTSNGYSGIWLASAAKKNGGHFSTIEFWDKRQTVAKENFNIANLQDVSTFYLGPAFIVLDNIRKKVEAGELEKFDFVFIDANKKEYLEYFNLLQPILTEGAYIYSDNMLSHAKKVKPYSDKIENLENYESELLSFGTGILKAHKKD